MKLVVINLERDHDRRAKMRERFAAIGLDPEIFPAVDGLTLTAEQRDIVDNETRILRTPYEMGRGAIGCLLSHLGVWRLCAEGADDMIAVFEDDAAPTPRLPEALAAIERLGPRFDFVKLSHGRSPLRVVPCADIGGFVLGRPRFHDIYTQAYVVSRAGARRGLALKKWPLEVDLQLSRWWDHGIDYYSVDPPVVRHGDGGRSVIRVTDGIRQRLPSGRGTSRYLRRRALRLRDSLIKRLKFAAWTNAGRRRGRDE